MTGIRKRKTKTLGNFIPILQFRHEQCLIDFIIVEKSRYCNGSDESSTVSIIFVKLRKIGAKMPIYTT